MEIKLTIDDQHAAMFLHFLQSLTYVKVQDTKPIKARKIVPPKKAIPNTPDPTVWKSLPITEKDAQQLFRPTRATVTVEELIQEQNFKGTNWARVEQIGVALAIQEPLEMLLTQLSE
jgi:hypothetical protein